jgi:hypothetical protein
VRLETAGTGTDWAAAGLVLVLDLAARPHRSAARTDVLVLRLSGLLGHKSPLPAGNHLGRVARVGLLVLALAGSVGADSLAAADAVHELFGHVVHLLS